MTIINIFQSIGKEWNKLENKDSYFKKQDEDFNKYQEELKLYSDYLNQLKKKRKKRN